MEFFTYLSPYRDEYIAKYGSWMQLNVFEKYLPLIILFTLIYLLFKYREVFRNNKLLDKRLRYSVGIIFVILYSSHYILRFSIYGLDPIILPFQLCSISMFTAIILIFTKNRVVYSFTLYTGVIGGLISLFIPVIGYGAEFYRYYQYTVAHGILIITPLYFLIVHRYYPSKKESVKAFLILQTIATFMMFYNYYNDTDFMFLLFDKSKITKFPMIKYFGGIPYYIILVEFAAMGFVAGFYQVINKLKNKFD